MWNFIIPALATVASGLIGSSGQKEANTENIAQAQATNEFNAEQAELQRGWSAEQAAKSMEFSERMSNTSFQRGVKDMKSAGLNPMLAYSQGGASAPQGTQGSGSSASGVTATVHNEMPAIGALAGVMNSAAQYDKTIAETDKIRAETDTEKKRPDQVGMSTTHMSADINRIQQEVRRVRALSDSEEARASQIVKQLAVEYDIKVAEEFARRLSNQHDDLDLERAKREAEHWASEYGKYKPFVHDLGVGTSSATQIYRMFRGRR